MKRILLAAACCLGFLTTSSFAAIGYGIDTKNTPVQQAQGGNNMPTFFIGYGS